MAKGASIIIRISGNSKSFRKELDRIEKESKKTIKTLDKDGEKLTRETEKESQKRIRISKSESDARIRNAKRVALVLAALAVAGIAASVIEFAKFEQGLAGVSKTTDIVGKDLQDLGKDITKLSIAIGTSTQELLETAKAAGQLGIKGSSNILKFTETITKLGKTTNIAGEEAAISLARLLTITNESFDNIDRLGSVIVELGNNFAALESEIVFTATEIAGAGVQFGITATQAFGLAAAFSELAIRPELARSTIIRSFTEINKAINQGGEALLSLISITGLTEDQLRKTFKENSVEVFQVFLDGLNRIQKGGGDTTTALEGLNLQGIRLLATLPKLAKGTDVVREALETAGDQFERNTALNKELGIQLNTTIGRYNQLKAELESTKREIGEEFIPVVESQIRTLKKLSPFIRNTLVPTLRFLIEGISEVAIQFDLMTESVRRFLGIPIEGKFEDMRDLIKEESGLQTGLSSLISKFIKLKDVSDEITTPEIIGPEVSPFGEILDPESAEKVRSIQEDIANIMSEAREAEKEALAEEAEERIAIEQTEKERVETERAAKLAVDIKAIDEKEKRDKKAAKKEVAEREKAERLLKRLKEDRVRNEILLDKAVVDSALDSLSVIVGDNKVAQIALFLAKKAVAIQSILILSQEAAALAIATVPPPLGEAIAAERLAAGRISAAIVAATALPELIGKIRSGQDGGVVPGGFGGGDRIPFLLEPGEIITPERLNPLSPNFDETFGGAGGQEITVNIELSEEASQFITVGQREDDTLGIQS